MRKFITLFFICSSLLGYSKTIWVLNTSASYVWENNDWKNTGWNAAALAKTIIKYGLKIV